MMLGLRCIAQERLLLVLIMDGCGYPKRVPVIFDLSGDHEGEMRYTKAENSLSLGEKGIRVNSIAYGFDETDLTSGKVSHPHIAPRLLLRIPLGCFGRAEETSGAAVFLVSPASSYFTENSLSWTADGRQPDNHLSVEKTMQQALDGIKILDLTRLLPGAFCTQMLADYGAEVLKIEHPVGGDYNRQFAPINKEESGSFLLLNRNKRSLTLDLKQPEGKDVFRSLAREADVIVEGFRPGVMKRLGLDYETLREDNSGLVYCAITGYGQDGPYAHAAGHDLNYMALSGALQLFGTPQTGPIVPGLSIADVGGGSLMAAFGILAALTARKANGKGQFVDISMTDGLVSWLCYHAADYLFEGIEPKGGERPFLGSAPCYNVYRCADGGHISLGVIEEHFWVAFCNLIGRPDLTQDQWPSGPVREKQFADLAAIFLSAPRDVWTDRLAAADIPASPVNGMAEAFADPQLQHRQMLFHMEHPREGRIPQLGFPIKFSETPGRARTPPPLLGEHTVGVLTSLGYANDAIDDLRNKGVI